MKILSCYLENFSSYKELEFIFDEQGLTLIQGPTGSGKSTLCDAIPWVLFGRTAKDGAVDEVISWNAQGSTTGTINLLTSNGLEVYITRSRTPNDLYYDFDGNNEIRGKDINDTQKQINNLLGIDHQLYLSGSYFHEFSQTAQFFITTAKNRRTICEQLVDLTLAKNLQTKLKTKEKILENEITKEEQDIIKYEYNIESLNKQSYKQKADNFDKNNLAKLDQITAELTLLNQKTDDTKISMMKKKLIKLKTVIGDSVCNHCGAKKHNKEQEQYNKLKYELLNEEKQLESIKNKIDILLKKYKEIAEEKNIYYELEEQRISDITKTNEKITLCKNQLGTLKQELNDAILLMSIINDYRSITIKNTIDQLETQVNTIFNNYFDSEIRVEFQVADDDKLDATIVKDGNKCVYTQLSKGQRQLLKLAFSVSVMRTIASKHAISFNCLFFDEALDGLSEEFKIKAYKMLEMLSLEYNSVFVVDHSTELKSLFLNKYDVALINGWSQIEKS